MIAAVRCDDRLRGRAVRRRVAVAGRQSGSDVRAGLGSDLDEETMSSSAQQLGQCQVESAGHLRARAHGDTEARPAGHGAVDRDNERVLPPRPVVGIDVAAADKHSVLDGDGLQLAGAHADEGEALLEAGSGVTVTASPSRRARQSRWKGGRRNAFQECWPTA